MVRVFGLDPVAGRRVANISVGGMRRGAARMGSIVAEGRLGGKRRAGRALPVADGYIAAIAAAHGACVATRDVRPYQSAGVEAVNPWVAEATER